MIDARSRTGLTVGKRKLEVRDAQAVGTDPELQDGTAVHACATCRSSTCPTRLDEVAGRRNLAAPSPKQAKASFTLSADKLAQPEGAGNWEDRYLNQVAKGEASSEQKRKAASSGSTYPHQGRCIFDL